jgi:hypothetical protein
VRLPARRAPGALRAGSRAGSISGLAAAWDRLRMTTRRLISWSAAGLAALTAAALLAAAGLVLWADGKKNDDGYLTSATHTLSTSDYAIASDDLDVDEDGPGDLLDDDVYGRVRLQVESHDTRPVFVGIAPTADVDRYLARTAHAEVTDVSLDPFRAEYRARGGSRAPAPPAEQGFWTASAHGTGPQTLTWKVRRGGWSVVVMNADGSRGVAAGVSAGADLPILTPLGWSLLGAGLLVALVAGGLVVVGVRSRPRPVAAVA